MDTPVRREWRVEFDLDEGWYVDELVQRGNLPWRVIATYGPLSHTEVYDVLDVLVWCALTGRCQF